MTDSPIEKIVAIAALIISAAVLIITPWPTVDDLFLPLSANCPFDPRLYPDCPDDTPDALQTLRKRQDSRHQY